MNANKQLEFQSIYENTLFETSNTISSIEDDIIAQRLMAKQRRASSSSDTTIFRIELTAVEHVSEKRNSDMARANILDFDDECDYKFNARNSSFTTAEDSLRNSVEMCTAKNHNFSMLSGIEFDRNLRASTSTQQSEKNSREVQQKLLLGLSALSATVNKVQTKDVAFKFAYLKIFAQLNALKNKKTEAVSKSSSKLRLPDKKKAFYRQWFKANKVNQETGCGDATNAHHTLAARD